MKKHLEMFYFGTYYFDWLIGLSAVKIMVQFRKDVENLCSNILWRGEKALTLHTLAPIKGSEGA